jgi:hypothetical protein
MYVFSIRCLRNPAITDLVNQFGREIASIETIGCDEQDSVVKATFTIDSYQPLAQRRTDEERKDENLGKAEQVPSSFPIGSISVYPWIGRRVTTYGVETEGLALLKKI